MKGGALSTLFFYIWSQGNNEFGFCYYSTGALIDIFNSMRQLHPFLLILLMAATLASCSTTYQLRQIDILRPAAYTLPSDARSVVLVNNTLPYRSATTHRIVMLPEYATIDSLYLDRMPVVIMESLKKELINRGYFDRVEIDTISIKDPQSKRMAAADQNTINNMAIRYGTYAVLLLDDFSYETLLQIDQPEYGWYFATLTADSKTLWRFSAIGGNTIGTFEVQKDTLYWSGEGNSPQLSTANIPNHLSVLYELGKYAGSRFANQITPYWESKSRVIFTSGNGYFMNAADWASKNNWDEASKLWNYIYQNGKTIEKARAASNIALAMEMEGRIDEAAIWCALSINEYDKIKSSYAAQEKIIIARYFRELHQRQEEVKKLKKQLNE